MVRFILQVAGKTLSLAFQAIALLLFLITSSPGISLAGANTGQAIDFEQRIACQTTLENIRWSHRIWPKENKTVKPSRPEILSDQQIRAKAENSLRMEAALAAIYGIEINNDMLQAELNRMARNTRAPERLQELFDALGNDLVTLAECLARPLLVRKKLYNSYVWDNRYHGDLRAEAEKAITLGYDPDSLAESGGRENLTVLVRMDEDTAPEAHASYEDESDEGFQRIELEADEYDREVARLTGDSEKLAGSSSVFDPATKIVLRETETAFVYEKVLNHADDQVEVQSVVWQKIGFNEWWQSQSSAWQTSDWLRTSQATDNGDPLT